VDLAEGVLVVENSGTGEMKRVSFNYAPEGSALISIVAAPHLGSPGRQHPRRRAALTGIEPHRIAIVIPNRTDLSLHRVEVAFKPDCRGRSARS